MYKINIDIEIKEFNGNLTDFKGIFKVFFKEMLNLLHASQQPRTKAILI